MSYELFITRRVQKYFVKIDEDSALRAKKDIEKLSSDPRSSGCKKLKDRKGWRIRSGNYRVVYEVLDSEKKINILHIGHRKDVYK